MSYCTFRTYILKLIPSYSQQDATFLDLFISKDALHVSGGSSARHQEYTTVRTASGIVNSNDTIMISLELTISEAVCTDVCS
jgi:hypothetical protein